MITLQQLRKTFDGQVVLDDLDLEIPSGRITAIIGPSGEGKSVLLKHMIGLLKPDDGRVLIDGENIVSMGRVDLNRVREKFGVLFQNAALFDSMTVFDNVAFPLREKTQMLRDEIRDRVHDALEHVGLRGVDNKYPDQLSGGMRKRVGLARALLLDPSFVLFDEPTTGLDPVICNAMHKLIKDTHDRFGFTAVIVTHEVPAIFNICDYVAMLYRGKILFRGTPDEIRAADEPAVRQFINGELEGPLKFL